MRIPPLFKDHLKDIILKCRNFDVNHDLRFRLKQGENIFLEVRIKAKDDKTVEVKVKSGDIAGILAGFYDIEIERDLDKHKFKHQKRLLLTKRGDLWNSGATETSEEPRDGKIDIFDVSRLFSKWNSIKPEDLKDVDINGPAGVSDGKIDLFDANRMMANWNP